MIIRRYVKVKITVINGTEKHGVTYRMKEMFLDLFRNDSIITEYYLPGDCPNFCAGCTACFLKGQEHCKDAEYVQKIEKSMLEADVLEVENRDCAWRAYYDFDEGPADFSDYFIAQINKVRGAPITVTFDENALKHRLFKIPNAQF